MTKERKEVFKEYIRKWDFNMFPLMPIAEAEAEWLIELFDRMDRQKARHHDWYMENQEEKNADSKARYWEWKEKMMKELMNGEIRN